MSLAKLRRDHPDWTWKAERNGGGGWDYEGVRDHQCVRVYATAELCGPSEDDYATVWRVFDGKTSETFSLWSFFTDDP